MITHLRTVGFKGFDIDEDIPPKVIYTGPNMRGKSTRAYGIAFALEGNVSFSTAGKQPGDVLSSFGSGDLLASAVTIGKTEFGRKIVRNETGKISTSVQIDKKKVSKENFAIMLDKAGKPKIADVAEFMRQSDAKKVDTLFELYPCPELAEIDTEIDDAKAEISRINTKIDGAEATVKRLTQSKESYQLPAGSISECQAEIKTVESKIADLEKQIHESEIAEAEEKARAEGERKERERAENEKHEDEMRAEAFQAERFPPESDQLKTDQDWEEAGINSIPDSPDMIDLDKKISRMESDMEGFRAGTVDDTAKLPEISYTLKSEASFSIVKIIDAMTQTGCRTCAALIVAKQELKKYKGEP